MEIHRLHDELAIAVERAKWKTAKNRAKAIIKLLPLAVHKDPKISKTGTPHLDGVYNIGWQRLAHAPSEAREIIEKMNDAIHQARKNMPKTKKNKKKKN